jgi:hypothetical protein
LNRNVKPTTSSLTEKQATARTQVTVTNKPAMAVAI